MLNLSKREKLILWCDITKITHDTAEERLTRLLELLSLEDI